MLRGSWTNRQVSTRASASSRMLLALVSVALLAGCGDSSTPLADLSADYEPKGVWSKVSASAEQPSEIQRPEIQLIPTWKTPDQPPESQLTGMMSVENHFTAADSSEKYWAFLSEEKEGPTLNLPALIRLPEVEVAENHPTENNLEEQPIALLLPPQAIEAAEETPEIVATQLTVADAELTELTEIDDNAMAPAITPTEETALPVLAELSEQEKLLMALVRDASTATTGVLTDARVNELAKSKIQRAYAMANRGSLYVARQELIEVLRLISQAKDAQQGAPHRSVALAAGLRALRESEDFAPRGTQLEAELDTAVLCASHRTPVAKRPESANLLPRLMMDRYLRYAQLQLSMSVASEPAGSMALHALGKLHSQLGRVEPDKHRLAERHAIAYQQAALLAHNQNYLAAHELAVLLAGSGHYVVAEKLLLQVAARSPNAVVHRNLARVQEKLGRTAQAAANLDYAQQLVQRGAVGTNNIRWVSPDVFTNVNAQAPRYRTAQTASRSTAQTRGAGQPPLPGQRQPLTTPQWR